MKEIPIDLMKELLKYIEDSELAVEHERGKCQSLEQLKSNNEMPKVYNDLEMWLYNE